MNDQPTALRLADALADYTGVTLAQMDQAAAELRRLHALNAELLEALKTAVVYAELRLHDGATDVRVMCAAIKKAEGEV